MIKTKILQYKYAQKLLILLCTFFVAAGCSVLPWQYETQQVTFKDNTERLQGELYLPKTSDIPIPAVVVVHGGSWIRRTGDMESISKKLAAQGLAAFNITYRSAKQNPYPAAVMDVRDAIAWLKANADAFNIDANRVGGWGYSAGGQLILRAGLEPETGLKAIVSGGTPARFEYWPHSPIITRFIGMPYTDAPEQWQDASPVNHVHADSPAVFLYHGAEDKLVEPIQMDFMAQALAAKGVPHQVQLVEGRGHMGTYLFNDRSEAQAIDFLQRWL